MTKLSPGNSELAHSYAVRLMQHLVVPTFVIDPKRRVVIWNRACERLTGVSASEVIGTTKHWRAFYEHRRYCVVDGAVAAGLRQNDGEFLAAVPRGKIGQADQALYAAKRLGRNRVVSAETTLAEIVRFNGGKLAGSRTRRSGTH